MPYQYSYDPITQTYRQLTPQERADIATQQQYQDYGGGGDSTGSSGPGSAGPGSGGIGGDVGLGLMGYGQLGFAPGALAASVIGTALADQAIAQQAAVDAQLAEANAQANQATVSQGFFGPTVSTAVDISPVAVAPAPAEEAIAGLVAANAAQQAEAQAPDTIGTAAEVAAAVDAATTNEGMTAADATGVGATSDSTSTSAGVGGGDGISGGADTSTSDSGSNDGGGSEGEREGGLIAGKRYRYGGGIMSYAQGGMPNTGQSLAAQGRYGDSMLVHMTPQEVGGLQTLARSQGTSMTVNPNTGLPEAFNLKQFLPAIAGAGLAMIPGMQLNPLTIGLLTGGLGAAMTGDLRQGLMIGLGAAGGAGIAGSMANLAAPAVTAPPITAPISTTSPIVSTAMTPGSTPVAFSSGIGSGVNSGGAQFIGDLTKMPSAALKTGAASFAPGAVGAEGFGNLAAGQMAPLSAPVTPATVGQGASKVFSSPSTVFDFAKANKADLGMAASPLLASAFEAPKLGEPEKTGYRPYGLDIENLSGRGGYGPGSTYEREQLRYRFSPQPMYYAAQGGSIGIDEDLDVDTGQIGAYSDTFADGGLAAFKRGTFLNGSGDGMSDSIPAVIANKQPARLADGEFVVPADVVSGLGNGSSNAGAKQLHAMMDRVRQGRTGKKRQAPEIKPDKYMPA